MRDVAFSCDDNGANYLRVAVWSLLRHFNGEEQIRVNVFVGFGGHSEASRAELAKVVAGFPNATLRYVDVEQAIEPYRDLILNREKSRWNVFTWAPIFTPLLLEDAVGPVIHFDIDMLFNADISPLFASFDDSPEALIACSYEYNRCQGKVESAIWDKRILPPEVERYFNTGILVFNTAKCREEKTWERILNWYRDHYEIADRIEQDAWNALYHDRVVPLPVKWNFHDRNMKGYAKWNLEDKFWLGNPPSECMEAALNPAILHFWGPKKPWKRSHRPYRSLYHDAMREVGLRPPKEPFLAWYYNLVNAYNRWLITRRLTREARSWARKRFFKRIKAYLLAPLEWFGIGLGFAVFAPLSHTALFKVCDFVSYLYYRFDFRGRALAYQNLKVMFPRYGEAAESKRFELIVRRSYRNMTRTIGHAFWTSFNARERVESVGIMSARCHEFLMENRPAITVSAHLGCWEILSQLALLEGHKMMSVAKDIGTRGMTRLLMRSRRSIGQKIVSADGAFKPLLQGIKDGYSLGLLVDQTVSVRKGGVYIKFFGRQVPVSAAPAFFAAKTKAPIVVAWSRPLKDGRYCCEYLTSHTSEEARDIRQMTQTIASDLEAVIRRHPSCWILNYAYYSRSPKSANL